MKNIQNEKAKNTRIREQQQINTGISTEIKKQIKEFLTRNPNYIFNRLGGTSQFFNWEKEKSFLLNLKRELQVSWSELYSLIYLVKNNQL